MKEEKNPGKNTLELKTPSCYKESMMNERMDEMEIGTATREWVEGIAGQALTNEEINQFLKDYNDWLDIQEESLEISPEIYTGD
jgi:hypothetical protein